MAWPRELPPFPRVEIAWGGVWRGGGGRHNFTGPPYQGNSCLPKIYSNEIRFGGNNGEKNSKKKGKKKKEKGKKEK